MNPVIFKLAGALILACSGVAAWIWMDVQSDMRAPLRVPGGEQVFVIEPGDTLATVSGELARRGILSHPRWFYWEARRLGRASRIQAGEYLLRNGETPRELLDKFTRGEVIQYDLTLVEGWTFAQIMQAVHAHPGLTHRLTGLAPDQIMARLGRPGEHPEGRFLADTYFFPRGTTDVAFLRRAMAAMDSTLARLWENRAADLPYRTPYEALIMASIIEKETGLASERARIGGVFVRRLQRAMRLQADPTVIYALGGDYDGNIRKRDLARNSPYNTYVVHGLPPTPIASPGVAALRAALHPAPGSALYFVARGDGGHVFSDTLEEHERAVDRYQRKRAGRQ